MSSEDKSNSTQSSTDSSPPTMPPEAPEAPRDAVTPPPVKDDNLSQNSAESQVAESVPTAQMATESEQIQTLEAPAETTTAQTAGNEPLSKPIEPFDQAQDKPITPEPTLVSITPQPKNSIRELFVKAREAIQFRKRKKLNRVMTLFAKRTNITNNQVGELLHVSDATATRYLEILEKENKIKQVGKTGKGVSYIKI